MGCTFSNKTKQDAITKSKRNRVRADFGQEGGGEAASGGGRGGVRGRSGRIDSDSGSVGGEEVSGAKMRKSGKLGKRDKLRRREESLEASEGSGEEASSSERVESRPESPKLASNSSDQNMPKNEKKKRKKHKKGSKSVKELSEESPGSPKRLKKAKKPKKLNKKKKSNKKSSTGRIRKKRYIKLNGSSRSIHKNYIINKNPKKSKNDQNSQKSKKGKKQVPERSKISSHHERSSKMLLSSTKCQTEPKLLFSFFKTELIKKKQEIEDIIQIANQIEAGEGDPQTFITALKHSSHAGLAAEALNGTNGHQSITDPNPARSSLLLEQPPTPMLSGQKEPPRARAKSSRLPEKATKSPFIKSDSNSLANQKRKKMLRRSISGMYDLPRTTSRAYNFNLQGAVEGRLNKRYPTSATLEMGQGGKTRPLHSKKQSLNLRSPNLDAKGSLALQNEQGFRIRSGRGREKGNSFSIDFEKEEKFSVLSQSKYSKLSFNHTNPRNREVKIIKRKPREAQKGFGDLSSHVQKLMADTESRGSRGGGSRIPPPKDHKRTPAFDLGPPKIRPEALRGGEAIALENLNLDKNGEIGAKIETREVNRPVKVRKKSSFKLRKNKSMAYNLLTDKGSSVLGSKIGLQGGNILNESSEFNRQADSPLSLSRSKKKNVSFYDPKKSKFRKNLRGVATGSHRVSFSEKVEEALISSGSSSSSSSSSSGKGGIGDSGPQRPSGAGRGQRRPSEYSQKRAEMNTSTFCGQKQLKNRISKKKVKLLKKSVTHHGSLVGGHRMSVTLDGSLNREFLERMRRFQRKGIITNLNKSLAKKSQKTGLNGAKSGKGQSSVVGSVRGGEIGEENGKTYSIGKSVWRRKKGVFDAQGGTQSLPRSERVSLGGREGSEKAKNERNSGFLIKSKIGIIGVVEGGDEQKRPGNGDSRAQEAVKVQKSSQKGSSNNSKNSKKSRKIEYHNRDADALELIQQLESAKMQAEGKQKRKKAKNLENGKNDSSAKKSQNQPKNQPEEVKDESGGHQEASKNSKNAQNSKNKKTKISKKTKKNRQNRAF